MEQSSNPRQARSVGDGTREIPTESPDLPKSATSHELRQIPGEIASPAVGTVPALSVCDLRVSVGSTAIIKGISFAVLPERILGLAGESGSGKSVTCLTALRLQPTTMSVSGSIRSDGRDVLGFSKRELRNFRATKARMVFQDPSSSFDAFMSIGAQLTESLRTARRVTRRAARNRSIEMLASVGIPDPAKRFEGYPRELSGGMLQRASIAMALVAEPSLLICDEPTTALDVTTAIQILDLLRSVCQDFHVSVVLTTHDLGVVADYCDEVAVMYNGEVVEVGPARPCIEQPHHPYTWSLVNSAPGRSSAPPHTPLPALSSQPALVAVAEEQCAFAARCPFQGSRCLEEKPQLMIRSDDSQRRSACLFSPTFADRSDF